MSSYEAYGSGALLLRPNHKISANGIERKGKWLKTETVLKVITAGDLYYSKYEKGYIFELYHIGSYGQHDVKKDLDKICAVFRHALVSGGVKFTGDNNDAWSFVYDGDGFAQWNIDATDEYTYPTCSNDKCVFNCMGVHPILGRSSNVLTKRCCAPPPLKWSSSAPIKLDPTRTRVTECHAYVDRTDIKFQPFYDKSSSNRTPLRSARTIDLLKRITPNALGSCKDFMLALRSDTPRKDIAAIYGAVEAALDSIGMKPCDITPKVLDMLENENRHAVRALAEIYGEYYTLDEVIYNTRALSAGDEN